MFTVFVEFFSAIEPRVTAKGINRNRQTGLRAVNPKQGIFNASVLVETLDDANDIVRSEDYIIYL